MQPPAPPPQPFQHQMQQQFGRGGTDRERGGLRTPRDVAALVSMLDNLTGGDPKEDLPLAALQEATKHVATFSRKAAPKLIQQKRNFVRGWYEEQRELSGIGPSGHGPGSPSSPNRLREKPSADSVFVEVDARLKAAQRSITQFELAESHVDALSEQIAMLVGIQLPTMTRDRRELIHKWHAQEKRQRGGSGTSPLGATW